MLPYTARIFLLPIEEPWLQGLGLGLSWSIMLDKLPNLPVFFFKLLVYVCTMCICVCVCHRAHLEVRGSCMGLVHTSAVMWALRIELRSAGLHGKYLYPMSHLSGAQSSGWLFLEKNLA